jgi:hypothetical protein
MDKSKKSTSVLSKAKSWATKNNLFGTQAFLRYIIFRFVENLNQVSNQFVFKGGNLLWLYIQTPRGTIDLDLSTSSSFTEKEVRAILNEACAASADIQFKIVLYEDVIQETKKGAAIVLGYQTQDGAKNQFEVDLVFAAEENLAELPSPIDRQRKIKCVSLENIISDKLSTCHRFQSGNSRMKDFDDLWRLSQNQLDIDQKTLSKLLKKRGALGNLDSSWVTSELEKKWQSHPALSRPS